MRTRLFALFFAVCMVASTSWAVYHPAGAAARRPVAGHTIIARGACQSDICG